MCVACYVRAMDCFCGALLRKAGYHLPCRAEMSNTSLPAGLATTYGRSAYPLFLCLLRGPSTHLYQERHKAPTLFKGFYSGASPIQW